MSDEQSDDGFQGIVACIPNFQDQSCLTKTIEFGVSAGLFCFGILQLAYFLSRFTFKDKMYINLALIFMLLYFLTNMIYCFWNNIYQLYSLQTYFNNLYFLCIVVFTIKSCLVKQAKPRRKLSRESDDEDSIDSEQTHQNSWMTNSCYRVVYRSMGLVFLLLFTMIFITSLVGDIQTNEERQQQLDDGDDFFSFLKDSCQELWYLCVNIVCVVLSVIVMVIVYRNYKFERQRLKSLTLNYKPEGGILESQKTVKMNNPLNKLLIWIGINILGQIINLVESGLLLNADPTQQCMIVPDNPGSNSLVKLVFVLFTVDMQLSVSLWFFYQNAKSNHQLVSKSQKLLESQDYSQEIKVGNLEMNAQRFSTSSSGARSI